MIISKWISLGKPSLLHYYFQAGISPYRDFVRTLSRYFFINYPRNFLDNPPENFLPLPLSITTIFFSNLFKKIVPRNFYGNFFMNISSVFFLIYPQRFLKSFRDSFSNASSHFLKKTKGSSRNFLQLFFRKTSIDYFKNSLKDFFGNSSRVSCCFRNLPAVSYINLSKDSKSKEIF